MNNNLQQLIELSQIGGSNRNKEDNFAYYNVTSQKIDVLASLITIQILDRISGHKKRNGNSEWNQALECIQNDIYKFFTSDDLHS